MHPEQLERVTRRLIEALPDLSAQVADLVHREQESYSGVSDEELALAVRRNMETAIRALRGIGTAAQLDLDQVRRTIHERYEAGIPMEETVRAFALCIWQIHQRFLEVSAEEDLLRTDVLECSDTLWQLGDLITTRVVVAYNELNLRQSLIDVQRRAQFVRRLLTGGVSTSELRDAQFDLSRSYAAVRCVSTAVS